MTSTFTLPPQTAADYTVACICPMGVELAPVEGMLDEIHECIPISRGQNVYTLGKLGAHNIVVAILPETGTNMATMVATQLLNDFPAIRFTLLVGIGGGVPGTVDVRLGDVVVSQATDTFGGVVQYDLGKRTEKGCFQRTGFLNKPPAVLSASVRKLDSQHRRQGSKVLAFISDMLQRYPTMQAQYSHPSTNRDDLFLTSYLHQPGTESDQCDKCDRQWTVQRATRSNHEAYIHYGTIGSANLVVKDATLRDQLHTDANILCVEMEAAGLMNDFPCLIIRGICDYADSHKNNRWQSYAAAVAAAYMKELLLMIPVQQVTKSLDAIHVAEPFNKHFDVPHLLSPVFTARDDICLQLESSLALAPFSRHSVQRRFVLFGLGGSGKTQICLRYAQTHRHRYWGVFWVDASTSDSIQQSMVQISLVLEVETNIASVKRALSRVKQSWLLVFDNADDPDLSLSPYLPTGDNGDVIITSRNPGCRSYHTVGYREIGPMSPSDSLTLLHRIVYGDLGTNKKHDDCGEIVVERLGYLALAVTQAGAYIRETACTFNEYLELYQRQCQRLLAYYPNHNGTDYHHTVYTTWQVSLDRIAAMQDEASKMASNLLQLLCFYNHDQIPNAMFFQAWYNTVHGTFTNPNAVKNANEWGIWPTTASDHFDFRQAMQTSVALLNSFSLITRDADASLSLHPVVRDWCQTRLDMRTRLSSCRRAISLLATSVRWAFTTEDYTYRRLLIPHVLTCIRSYPSMYIDADDRGGYREWEVLALILEENGFLGEALQLTQIMVERSGSRLSEENPYTINLMHQLATRYAKAGRYEDAVQLAEKVLRLGQSNQDKDLNVIHFMHNLACRYSEVQRFDEALQLAEKVVHLQKSDLGEKDPETINAIHSLAIQYAKVGRGEEALRLQEQVVKLQEDVFGHEHPYTILALYNLVGRYGEAGRHEEAIQLGEEVVRLRKQQQGDDHPETCLSMFGLAHQYYQVGRYMEALQLEERVLKVRIDKLGEDHPHTISSMHNLAIAYSNAGRYNEALQLALQAVEKWKTKQGDNSSDLSRALYSLAKRYGDVQRHEEAIKVADEMVQLVRERLNEDHPDMQKCLELQAWVKERAAEARIEHLDP